MSDAIPRDVQERASSIFMPDAARALKEWNDATRLVHYTTAENAVKILRSRSLWLRNARAMHDFSEVEYGFVHLRNYFGDETRKSAFFAPFKGWADEIPGQAIAAFDKWWGSVHSQTYVACFSKHEPNTDEEQHGRLSMWRAFARSQIGVAMVLKFPAPYSALPLRTFLTEVRYWDEADVHAHLRTVYANIAQDQEWLKTLQPEFITNMVLVMLILATVSTKHSGFREEREWRLVHLPTIIPSPFIVRKVHVIGGIPQAVQVLELINRPADGIDGIEPRELVDKIIVGPNQYGLTVADALASELAEAGVPEPARRIVFSGIPLRPSI